MEKSYKVSLTELVTYSKRVTASSEEEALDIMSSNYGYEDEDCSEYHSHDVSSLSD